MPYVHNFSENVIICGCYVHTYMYGHACIHTHIYSAFFAERYSVPAPLRTATHYSNIINPELWRQHRPYSSFSFHKYYNDVKEQYRHTFFIF